MSRLGGEAVGPDVIYKMTPGQIAYEATPNSPCSRISWDQLAPHWREYWEQTAAAVDRAAREDCEHRLLDAIAFTLYLQTWLDDYEKTSDLGDESLRRLRAKWVDEFLPGLQGEHCGDCTKVPAPCLRCVMDEWFSEAKAILGAIK